MSAPEVFEARRLTDSIRANAEHLWTLIARAYETRAWAALGYPDWDHYCSAEFGRTRLRLPREERTLIVGSLRDSGLSMPAIAAATGLSVGTIHAEISSGFQYRKPDELDDDELDDEPAQTIIGTDGKHYPSTKPTRPTPVIIKPTPERIATERERELEAGRRRANNYIAEAVHTLARGGHDETVRFIAEIWPDHAEHVPQGMRITAWRLDEALDLLTALREEFR